MVKTIAIVGGSGFIGSWVTDRLLADGFQVIILKRSDSSLAGLAHLSAMPMMFDTDTMSLHDIFSHQPVDVVINLATDYGRGSSVSRVCHNNIVFALELAEAAIRHQVRYYWNTDSYWNTESALKDAINVYAYTKKVTREILEHEFSSQIPIFNLQLFHVFGERDNPTKFLSHVVRTFKAGSPLAMTDGTQQLDFIYVKEVAHIFSFILQHLEKFPSSYEHFQIGMGNMRPLRDVVVQLKAMMRSSSEIQFGAVPVRKNEILSAAADITKLLEAGYTFQTTVDEGLEAISRE